MRKYNIILLLIFSALAWGSCVVDGEKEPEPKDTNASNENTSFAWMFKNHNDKIAHYDKDRNIIQIKVLDQIKHGARQCGYHGVRNFFYLAALSEAIKNRILSSLIRLH